MAQQPANHTVGTVAASLGLNIRQGEPNTRLTGIGPIETAAPGQLTFVASPKYRRHCPHTQASVVLLDEATFSVLADSLPGSLAVLITPEPYLKYAEASRLFATRRSLVPARHPLSSVSDGATLGQNVEIGPFVVIEDGAAVGDRVTLHAGVHIHAGAVIEQDSTLHDHVVIHDGCTVGARCILHAGVVVGSDGYGFAPDKSADRGKRHQKIAQLGVVVIEDDVEMGANVCVDRAALGETRIGAGTKIDNLVHIAHNVSIGADSLLVAQVGIAGSTSVGERVTLGGQTGVAGHIQLGDDVVTGGQAGVTQSLDAGSTVMGTPALPLREFYKTHAYLKRLSELFKKKSG